MEPPLRYAKIYLVRLQTSEGRHAPLGAGHTALPAVSILHGQWLPTNHCDDSKNVLAMSITLSLLKEIITYKKGRKHTFNSQIKVLSALSN